MLLYFTHQLKQERERRCWSQAEVAAKIQTDAFTVSRWECGITFPSLTFRRRLCKLFGKSAEELGLLPEEHTSNKDLHHSSWIALDQHPSRPLTATLHDPAIPSPLPRTIGLVGRDEQIYQLKHEIYTKGGSFALRGLPGVGKTALAVELAQDSQVQEHFQDGVLWAGLGKEPNVPGLLSKRGTLLNIAPAEIACCTTLEAWVKTIHHAIGMRRMLLIIDDAWNIEDALVFKVGELNCVHLLTTRFPAIAHQFASENSNILTVHELGEKDSVTLLVRLAPQIVTGELSEAEELARSVGGLPLALTLMGKYLHMQTHSGQPRRLRMAIERLHHGHERLRLCQPQPFLDRSPSLPTSTPVSLQAAIEISDDNWMSPCAMLCTRCQFFPPSPIAS